MRRREEEGQFELKEGGEKDSGGRKEKAILKEKKSLGTLQIKKKSTL